MAGVDIVVISMFGVRSLYSTIKKRQQMKIGDVEITKEAEREGEAESENQLLDVEVKHHKHPHHPLKEVEASDEEEFICGSCARLGRGRRYRCLEVGCGFQMHRACASSPVMLVGGDFGIDVLPETLVTFAHCEHGHLNKADEKLQIFDCRHCNTVGKGLRYQCESQGRDCSLHPICAKCPTRINSSMHPEHELVLTTRPYFAKCAVCDRGRKSNINNRVYACKVCKFYLHPTCSLWPLYLFHELHPKPHPLQLNVSPFPSSSSSSSSTCHACKKKCNGLVLYRCESCQESYHPLCLLRFSHNVKADGKPENAFKKEVAKQCVEFVGINHLGLVG